MSLTKATYSMVSGAPANVLDYGASTSASAAANGVAFAAALAASSNVYIPAGTYAIDTIAVPNKRVRIFGEGIETTILQTTGTYGINFDHFGSTNLNRFSVLEELSINNAVGTNGLFINNGGINATNLYIYGGSKAIWMANSVLGNYTNIVAAAAQYCIYVDNAPSPAIGEVVWLNTFRNVSCAPNHPTNYPFGLIVATATAAFFFKNTFIALDCEKNDIGFKAAVAGTASGNTFINCWFELNQTNNVFEAAGNANTWINPRFYPSLTVFTLDADSWYQDGNALNRAVLQTQIGWLTLDPNVTWNVGRGSPEGVLTAARGSLYTNTVIGGTGVTFYVKESGAGNTGWVGK